MSIWGAPINLRFYRGSGQGLGAAASKGVLAIRPGTQVTAGPPLDVPSWVKVFYPRRSLGQWYAEDGVPQQSAGIAMDAITAWVPAVGWFNGEWFDSDLVVMHGQQVVAVMPPGSSGWVEIAAGDAPPCRPDPAALGAMDRDQALLNSFVLAARCLSLSDGQPSVASLKLSLPSLNLAHLLTLCVLRMALGAECRLLLSVPDAVRHDRHAKAVLRHLRVQLNLPGGASFRCADQHWSRLLSLINAFPQQRVVAAINQRALVFNPAHYPDAAAEMPS